MRGSWRVTPSTRVFVYSFTGGSRRSIRSARIFSGSSLRSSASNRMSRARRRALPRADTSGPAEVLAGAGVDLDPLAGGDEQRHLDLGAGLQRGGLGAAGGAVALEARLGVGDGELDRGGQLDVERGAVVEGHGGHRVLQHVVGGVADGR